MTRLILAGDAGGTKTRIAVFEEITPASPGVLPKLKRGNVEIFDSKSVGALEELISLYIERNNLRGKLSAACFGVPGPCILGVCNVTNLPWKLSEKSISQYTGVPKVRLINDIAATVAAVPTFSDQDVVVLHPGSPEREKNVFAMLNPGTGLGQTCLFIDDEGRFHPLPSEGGHVEFSPIDDLGIELLNYMRKKIGKRVSVERVLCGPGLCNIYSFLRDTGKYEEPSALLAKFNGKDMASVISQCGISGEFPICEKAIDIFAQLLGSQAGDVVLSYLCTGGLYLGGGIPPKILSKLQQGITVSAYLRKGRLSHVVESTPLYVVKDDLAAVNGAAVLASGIKS
jgi:glucokinase